MSIFSKLLCFRRRHNTQKQESRTGSTFSRLLDFKQRICIRRRRRVVPIANSQLPVRKEPPEYTFATALRAAQQRIEKEDRIKEEEEDNDKEEDRYSPTLRDFMENLQQEEPYLADYIAGLLSTENSSHRKSYLSHFCSLALFDELPR